MVDGILSRKWFSDAGGGQSAVAGNSEKTIVGSVKAVTRRGRSGTLWEEENFGPSYRTLLKLSTEGSGRMVP